MQAIADIVSALRKECSEDYVGLWQISRVLTDANVPAIELSTLTLDVVSELLSDSRVDIGQFHEGVFVQWQGETEHKVSRLKTELQALGRPPDIGEIAWLAEQ